MESAATGEWAHSGEWECMECGYIEQGVRSRRPRECPDCGAPTQALEFFPFEGDGADGPDEPPPDDEDIFEDEDEGLG